MLAAVSFSAQGALGYDSNVTSLPHVRRNQTLPAAKTMPLRRSLLTVHLLTPSVVSELGVRLPSNDRLYYQRQRDHDVLIAVAAPPPNERQYAAKVAAQLGLSPREKQGRHKYRLGASPTLMHVIAVNASLPPGMPTGKAAPKATCAGRTWPVDYALYTGAWFVYHLLRLPIIQHYESYVKVDTDVTFHTPMPDLSAIMATHPSARIAHTALQKANDCERGIMAALHRFQATHDRHGPSSKCADPIPEIMYGNFIVFRSDFMTSPRMLALSAYLYEEEWSGYFVNRWGDQAPYSAFACDGLQLSNASLGSVGSPAILDLSHLRTSNVLSLCRSNGFFMHTKIARGRPLAEWSVPDTVIFSVLTHWSLLRQPLLASLGIAAALTALAVSVKRRGRPPPNCCGARRAPYRPV